jgi:hypothetical protein
MGVKGGGEGELKIPSQTRESYDEEMEESQNGQMARRFILRQL